MGKIIKNGIAYSTASENAYNINFNNTNTTLNAVTVQEAIAELNDKIDNFEIPEGSVSAKDVNITLSLDKWELNEDNKYSQVADVAGLTETATPLVLLKSTSEEILKAYNCITESIVEKDKIIFIADEVPIMDIDLVVKNVVPSDSTIVDDISELKEEVENKLAIGGDSKDNVVTYISNDSAEVNEYTEVELLTSGEKHSSLLNKVSTMFKNIRYIVKTLGVTDIGAIGDGTVKGAIGKLDSDLDLSGNYTYIPVTFGSNANTEGDYIGFIPIPHADEYTITIDRVSVVGGGAYTSLFTIASQTKLGIVVKCTDGNPVGKTYYFVLTLTKNV